MISSKLCLSLILVIELLSQFQISRAKTHLVRSPGLPWGSWSLTVTLNTSHSFSVSSWNPSTATSKLWGRKPTTERWRVLSSLEKQVKGPSQLLKFFKRTQFFTVKFTFGDYIAQQIFALAITDIKFTVILEGDSLVIRLLNRQEEIKGYTCDGLCW